MCFTRFSGKTKWRKDVQWSKELCFLCLWLQTLLFKSLGDKERIRKIVRAADKPKATGWNGSPAFWPSTTHVHIFPLFLALHNLVQKSTWKLHITFFFYSGIFPGQSHARTSRIAWSISPLLLSLPILIPRSSSVILVTWESPRQESLPYFVEPSILCRTLRKWMDAPEKWS